MIAWEWMEKIASRISGTKLKLQGGTLGPIQIATKAVRKYGTVQMTGVYGGNYNAFPLGAFWVRNINLKMGQAPVIHFMPELFKNNK